MFLQLASVLEQVKIQNSTCMFFTIGSPSNYADYFTIDSTTAEVTQILAIDRLQHNEVKLLIKAEETSKLTDNFLTP